MEGWYESSSIFDGRYLSTQSIVSFRSCKYETNRWSKSNPLEQQESGGSQKNWWWSVIMGSSPTQPRIWQWCHCEAVPCDFDQSYPQIRVSSFGNFRKTIFLRLHKRRHYSILCGPIQHPELVKTKKSTITCLVLHPKQAIFSEFGRNLDLWIGLVKVARNGLNLIIRYPNLD